MAVRKQSAEGSNSGNLSAETLQGFYRDMLLIRRFEERSGQLYGMGLIGGFCHLYIGQEAVVVGVQSVLLPGDTIVTSYRDHGHMLACGMEPKRVMAELTGRAEGYSKGKGGSMHMFSREKGFFGGHGIVGAQIPIGTGLAFGHKYKQDGGLCAAYMGDGAANQGQVYESYNMAALWKLPVLYIIENNKYGMGTSSSRHAAGDLYKRGEAYGIPGEQVDGMDVLAVREAVERMTAGIRAGQGPAILEMMTYRYRGAFDVRSSKVPQQGRSRVDADAGSAGAAESFVAGAGRDQRRVAEGYGKGSARHLPGSGGIRRTDAGTRSGRVVD